ncbi:MAG TPA: hypothetical protein VMV66_00735 [Candidatus Humimicrobiaceae bacterium]|nr:hypothetical protein [Candidatus Humimicrobiaceae bacterium]
MPWLIITVLAYFFLAVVSLFDRYFLVGPVPNPKTYTFYVGILWFFLSLVFLPFITFPENNLLLLGLAAGLIRIIAVFFLTKSIVESEISRVVPAIGGLLPIFSFFLFFLFLPQNELLNFAQILAFILLLSGSILISLKKFSFNFFSFKTLKYPILAAFLFALNFFLMKNLFLKVSFFSGFFLILLGGGLGVIVFLIFPRDRKIILSQKFVQRISMLFILGQVFGGLGVIFQQYAIFLAKPYQVPLINALEGIRYVFLLVFVFILSILNPRLLKEELVDKTLLQKIIAILLIGGGLALLTLK